MKPEVFIIGHKGNMGRRYGLLLDQMKVSWQGWDLLSPKEASPHFGNDGEDFSKFSHFIVATPTDNHLDNLNFLLKKRLHKSLPGVRVLCEKPIFKPKNMDELVSGLKIFEDFKRAGHELYMVNNYAYYEGYYDSLPLSLDKPSKTYKTTSYRYHNSGKDGLYWDCIQLFGLAEEDIYFSDRATQWKAELNGIQMDRDGVDRTYEFMLRDFLENRMTKTKLWAYPKTFYAHMKVLEYLEAIDYVS